MIQKIRLFGGYGVSHRPKISIGIECTDGFPTDFDMIVDTGSDYCMIPIEWVSDHGVAMRVTENRVKSFRTSSGAEGFALRGQFTASYQAREYEWPCYFILPPDTNESEASDYLEWISSRLPISERQPPKKQRRKPVGRHDTIRDWIEEQFGGSETRKGILGRKGFLDSFDVRINNSYLTIIRNGWLHCILRRLSDCVIAGYSRTLRFLRIEA
jgi:hypothetical protein